MEDSGIDETEVFYAVEKKSTASTEESEKVEPEKELDNGMSQLRDEDESLETIGEDMYDLHDEPVQETLDKDQVEEGVRENSSVEPNGEYVKEMDSVKETVVSAIVPVDAVEDDREVEASPCLTASSDSLTMKPSLSSDPAAASAVQGLSMVSVPSKQEQRSDSPVVNRLSVSPVPRTPARDGYNWRKYGQKQVKSPKGSRSYYRCTYSECFAKKIECSNDSGKVVEIVNKGLHSHEPPRKNSFAPREIRVASAIRPVSENNAVVKEATIVPNGSDPSASTRENICEPQTFVERKTHCGNEAVDEPEAKRRLKKDNSQSSDSVSKPGKKNKFVVHAAGDVGICGDGYRWRKYGQKMVKGNPHPRNYYRCTSAGCPVRKHIETAVENTTAVIITYKGVHNHDMPVPKKRHGPPSSMLVAAAAPTSMRTRTDDQVNIPTSSQCLVGRESEKKSEALDVGGEKVMESARTLLSIGFEIKQC
ncbi:PREDICTED: probable WRKY transcription factor 32 [Camelina sativa]|uniref:Probable WRKY transcription factor 32 n=1 Tax=Camelina sativa TaxID=90675 RepID=A0ABM0UX52_CAMSA|nr:PREDICTED: probable WRKY transcription factor 32 [Camelina sativa]